MLHNMYNFTEIFLQIDSPENNHREKLKSTKVNKL